MYKQGGGKFDLALVARAMPPANRGKGHRHKDQINHIAHPVVKQGFPGDFGFQRFAQAGFAQDPHNGNRIGGGNQRAEYQCHNQRHPGQPAKANPDNGGGQAHTQRCHQHYDFPLRPQIGQFHMQRPGEQQQAQHPF